MGLIPDIKIKVRVAKLQELDCAWNTSNFNPVFRIIPLARLYFPVEGEGFAEYQEKRYHIRPGYMYLFPPLAQIFLSCPRRLVKYWSHFNANVNGDIDIFSISNYKWELPAEDPEQIKKIFAPIVEAYKDDFMSNVSPTDKFEAECALGMLISPFLRTLSPISGQKAEDKALRFSQLLCHIEKNLSRKLTLAELAEHFGRHPVYLSNLFSESAGMPLLAYCRHRRIQRACELLAMTDLTVGEIAHETGFDHAANFSKMFKKIVGCWPSEYKKLNTKNAGDSIP